MAIEQQSWTLGELAQLFQAELVGDENLRVYRPAQTDTTEDGTLVFAASPKYLKQAEQSAATAVLIPIDATSTKPHLKVNSPRASFGAFLGMCRRDVPIGQGIHPTAQISPSATIDPTASVGAFCVIEAESVIGAGSRIHPFCYIGERSKIGINSVLLPNVVLIQDIQIGDRTIIHSGTVIGADGFGYVWDGERQVKVPQVGGVRIGSDVEIGALTAIDRATAGSTSIDDDTKIDNLVQIAHNVRIGKHVILVSQSGVAGSAILRNNVTLAGQAAVSDHITISEGVILGGRAAAGKDLTVPGLYMGAPAGPAMQENRQRVLQKRLPEILERLKSLEAEVAELKSITHEISPPDA